MVSWETFNIGYVQTAGKSDIIFFLKSGLFKQTVCTINCEWSNQICVSRRNQLICMGCFGYDVDVPMLLMRISKQTSRSPNKRLSSRSCETPLSHKKNSTMEETSIYCIYHTACRKRQFEILFEQPEHPYWDASVKIWLESYFKRGGVLTFKTHLNMQKNWFFLTVWIRP